MHLMCFRENSVKKAILYLREVRGESLLEQMEACRQYAEQHGFETHAAVIDLATRGPAYRLGLRGALDMVSAGDVEAFVAFNAERLSKDPTRLQDLEEMLREKNCELHYVNSL